MPAMTTATLAKNLGADFAELIELDEDTMKELVAVAVKRAQDFAKANNKPAPVATAAKAKPAAKKRAPSSWNKFCGAVGRIRTEALGKSETSDLANFSYTPSAHFAPAKAGGKSDSHKRFDAFVEAGLTVDQPIAITDLVATIYQLNDQVPQEFQLKPTNNIQLAGLLWGTLDKDEKDAIGDVIATVIDA